MTGGDGSDRAGFARAHWVNSEAAPMHVHFVAVAGTGMGALAGLCAAAGHRVTGSDVAFYPPMGDALRAWGIETREGFIPYNLQHIFIERGWTHPDECPVANTVAYSSFYLPTGPALGEADLDHVATQFTAVLDELL